MPQPFNYNDILAQQPSGGMTDVVRNAIFGAQQQQQNDNALAQQQFAAEQAKKAAEIAEQRRLEQGQMWGQLIKAPTPDNIFAYMTRFPEMGEGVKRAYDVLQPAQQQAELKTMVDVSAALDAGKPDLAKQILTDREAADKKAGIDTSHYGKLVEIIDASPDHATGLGRLALAAVLGKDKFAEAYGKLGEEGRARARLPAEIQKGQAEADKATAEAEAAPETIAATNAEKRGQVERWKAQTRNEIENMRLGWANLNLDADKLATETQLKIEELQQKAGDLSDSSLKVVNDSALAAQTSNALAGRLKGLAADLRASGARGGVGSGWAEWMKQKTGSQDAVSELRAQVAQVLNQQSLALLPPGPASDKDVAFVRQGMPDATTNPEYVASFLDAMARLQEAQAKGADRRANWAAANNGLGPAKRDMDIGGVMVPRGTTFSEFIASTTKNDKKGDLPSGISALIKKYGGRK